MKITLPSSGIEVDNQRAVLIQTKILLNSWKNYLGLIRLVFDFSVYLVMG